MAKPTEVPTWATNAGATSDPGPTRRAIGFQAGERMPAKWLNRLLNEQSGWLNYLANLHDETEFLNKVYSWTNSHYFTSGLATQGILISHATNEYDYAAARERTTYIPLSRCTQHAPSGGGRGWLGLDSYTAREAPEHDLYIPIELPTGATVRRLEARVTGVTTGTVMRLTLKRLSHGSSGTTTALQVSDDLVTTENTLICDVTGNPLSSVDNAASSWRAELRSGSDQLPLSGGFGIISWIRLVWLDPGPRNY